MEDNAFCLDAIFSGNYDPFDLELKLNLAEEEVDVLRDVHKQNAHFRRYSSGASSANSLTAVFEDQKEEFLPLSPLETKTKFDELWTEDKVSFLDEAFDFSVIDAVETNMKSQKINGGNLEKPHDQSLQKVRNVLQDSIQTRIHQRRERKEYKNLEKNGEDA